MRSQIIQQSKKYVQELLEEKLSDDFLFHDLAHTISVREFSVLIGQQKNLSDEDLEILEIAAWFHDTGYTECYDGHEYASCRIAQYFLNQRNYPQEKIDFVTACIDATRTNHDPETLLQEIIKDADLNNLGMESCYDLSIKLRHEWDVLRGDQYSDLVWLENNIAFLKQHRFYTDEANEMWKEGKAENLKKMEALAKVARAK